MICVVLLTTNLDLQIQILGIHDVCASELLLWSKVLLKEYLILGNSFMYCSACNDGNILPHPFSQKEWMHMSLVDKFVILWIANLIGLFSMYCFAFVQVEVWILFSSKVDVPHGTATDAHCLWKWSNIFLLWYKGSLSMVSWSWISEGWNCIAPQISSKSVWDIVLWKLPWPLKHFISQYCLMLPLCTSDIAISRPT